MKALRKTIAVILAVIMVLAVTPLSFAAVDTSVIAKGDVVTFGIYESDNDKSTQDALEWIVVGKDGNTLKLMTKYILETKYAFASRNSNGAWGAKNNIYSNVVSKLVESAFTDKEKAAIIPVDNGAVDGAGSALGSDLVYLPSIQDVTTAFSTDAERVSSNTAVAAATRNATAVGEPAQYCLIDATYKDLEKPLYYLNYVDATGAVHIASAEDTTILATKTATVGARLMTNVDASKLYTTGKDETTGVTPLVGTLGTHKVVWQCKCIDAEGNETIHTFTFLDANYQAVPYQMVDHGDAATPPEENDIITHRSNYHQGYEFVGWDKEYSEVTEDMVITAVYEEIPEVGILQQILNWIRSLFVLLLSLIEVHVLPVVNEWLEANLGFQIPW